MPREFRGEAAEMVARSWMATADKRQDTLETIGGGRRAAARLGLSPGEARRITKLAESVPTDDVALVSALAEALVERSLDHGWATGSVCRLLEEVAETSGWELDPLAQQVHADPARNRAL